MEEKKTEEKHHHDFHYIVMAKYSSNIFVCIFNHILTLYYKYDFILSYLVMIKRGFNKWLTDIDFL